jgi:hypothetical protein
MWYILFFFLLWTIYLIWDRIYITFIIFRTFFKFEKQTVIIYSYRRLFMTKDYVDMQKRQSPIQVDLRMKYDIAREATSL